jgi:formate-dependent nitrite reductase membrane component NrfD
MAEHFTQAPHWEWWIVGYFFVAGVAGGSYTLATMLRLWGSPRDEATARTAFLYAFPLAVLCGFFLTIDLGQPVRFWHMMINTTPGANGLNFKSWSPISVGTWALLLFSIFAFVSFLEAWGARNRAPTRPGAGMVFFNVLGSLVALFLASYTGVVLSVSNQPVWSDSYAIGGLFVASALSASAAMLSWIAARQPGAGSTERRLLQADGYFVVLEIIMLIAFFTTLANAGTLGKTLALPWLIVWILVVASFIPSLMGLGSRRQLATSAGTVTSTAVAQHTATTALIVILGVLLMRFVVVFSAQF